MHTHHHLQFSHISRSNGPTSPQQNQNIEKKIRCYQDSKGANQCSWGNLILRFWRASLDLGALLRGKKLFRGVCLAQPLTFFGANCCRKLSIAACLRFGCSAVIAHFLRISATTLQYFCNNTSVFLQLHFASIATHSIYTEAQQNSFDPKKCYVTNTARGPNRPFRCLDGNCH